MRFSVFAKVSFAAVIFGAPLACGPVADFVEELSEREDQRLTHTCERVEQCGGVVSSTKCEEDLADMVGDGRVSEERAVACAACAHDNPTCGDILERRHCDAACKDVSYMENLFTSSCIRSTLCRQVLSACAGFAPTEVQRSCAAPALDNCGDTDACNNCETGLRATLRNSPELDRSLALCADCVTEASPAASAGDAPVCETIVTRCQATCAAVPEIKVRLDRAAAVLRICAAWRACDVDIPDCADAAFAQLSPADGGSGVSDQVLSECESCLQLTTCEAIPTDACSSKCDGLGLTFP